MAGSSFIEVDSAYADLPWYRRRWFVVLSFLVFCPLTLAIAATGDLYALRNHRTYAYGPAAKRGVVFAACVFIVLGLLRVFHS